MLIIYFDSYVILFCVIFIAKLYLVHSTPCTSESRLQLQLFWVDYHCIFSLFYASERTGNYGNDVNTLTVSRDLYSTKDIEPKN